MHTAERLCVCSQSRDFLSRSAQGVLFSWDCKSIVAIFRDCWRYAAWLLLSTEHEQCGFGRHLKKIWRLESNYKSLLSSFETLSNRFQYYTHTRRHQISKQNHLNLTSPVKKFGWISWGCKYWCKYILLPNFSGFNAQMKNKTLWYVPLNYGIGNFINIDFNQWTLALSSGRFFVLFLKAKSPCIGGHKPEIASHLLLQLTLP